MTREEAIKLLDNTKVFVKNKSEEIQEKLFDIGFNWDDKPNKEVKYINSPFLFIYDTRMLTYSNDVNWFYNHPNKEITAEVILNITIEPKYRPFKDAAECWQEMLKHEPFGWLKSKNDNYLNVLESINNAKNYQYIFDNYTFADGTPFGIKED